jgi:glycosyltransferase involved in cell wall biosynthesis
MWGDPAISVAMPVYNGARFLGEAIASILGQTHSDFELIVSDDGSNDQSLEIARGYAKADPRVVVLASVHGGIGAAMNRALAAAKGAYFAPMDQDDVALPDRLERLLGFLEGRPDVALVGGGMRLIDADGKALGERRRATSSESVAEAMLTSCAVIHPTSMMRTAAARAVGGYRTAMPFAQDYDLWLRLMEQGHVANIADIVLLKRIHKGAVTQCHAQRISQVVARSAAYLSHLTRTLSVDDFVSEGEPLLLSTTRFINQLLMRDGVLPDAAYYNISRIMRYAPLATTEQQAANHPYWLYFKKLLRRKSGFETLRALWYAAIYFGTNRRQHDTLLAPPVYQAHTLAGDVRSLGRAIQP